MQSVVDSENVNDPNIYRWLTPTFFCCFNFAHSHYAHPCLFPRHLTHLFTTALRARSFPISCQLSVMRIAITRPISSNICNMSTKESRWTDQYSLFENSQWKEESISENCFVVRLIVLTRQIIEINVLKHSKQLTSLQHCGYGEHITRTNANNLIWIILDYNTSEVSSS